MTITEFQILCGELLIDEAIALESEEVVTALKNRCTYEELKKIMVEIF